MIESISVRELKEKIDQKENLVLVDCRESDEFEYCHIDGALHIPLSQFQQKAKEQLKPDAEIIIYCHRGMRSQMACGFLKEQGYQKVTNVTGGIEAWSLEVDKKVPRY